MPYNGYTIHETWQVIGDGFVARTIMSILLLPFASFTINYIQEKVETVVAFDTGRDSWNVFHWDIPTKITYSY